MLTATFSAFWGFSTSEKTTAPAPAKRTGPVFIGDAVQPWGRETMLLAIMRKDRDAQDDQPSP